MGVNIVFLDEYTVNGSDVSSIKELGNYTGYESTEDWQILERSYEADIVITNKTPFRAETISALPNLKLICVAATGMNNVDLNAAAEAGIKVMNAVDYSTHAVAEQTITGVLTLYKQILYYDNYVKSGLYIDAEKLFDFGRTTYELHGKKWGVIGLGNIGKRVISLADAFGCETAYYSTSGRNSDASIRRMELDQLLQWADVLSVHAPLSEKTYHLIGAQQLRLMKPTAVIANTARGSIIDERALAEAINSRLIAGAALDVYGKEPMAADNPILEVRDKLRLVLTPHTAWATKESLQRLVERVAGNIARYLTENQKQ